jgi:exoribonuclease R
VLQKYGYNERLLTLSQKGLPLLAECQQQGQAQLVSITDILITDDAKNSVKLGIIIQNEEETKKIVDLQQITTVWPSSSGRKLKEQEVSASDPFSDFPLGHVDRALDRLYNSYVGRARNQQEKRSLTRKQIAKLVQDIAPQEKQTRADQVLRQVVKTGQDFARLIDSKLVVNYLFMDKEDKQKDTVAQRSMASSILSQDAQSGGRFKRMGCLLVSQDDDGSAITVINGGWVVLDQNVRATSEGRKFAERGVPTASMADDRIVQRLECLAMGDDNHNDDELNKLGINIRETLRAMSLPMTPQGAKDALIQVGRWTASSNNENAAVNPWSKPVLEAAEWYQHMDEKRKDRLLTASRKEGRVDLTKLPCICVDASKTSFRDDAIGIRARASTGRRVSNDNKWEVLLHIADVSDLYAPLIQAKSPQLQKLNEAAASRGTSRYDLPLGPLHLLPPLVLHSLALQTTAINKATKIKKGVNRCVTVWVYLDEKTGNLLDCGLERTLISKPLALSYNDATTLLITGDKDEDPTLQKAKALLEVTERNLKRWSDYHRSKNIAAQAREERLAARELVGKQLYYETTRKRDDGRQGFQRSRGHQLVDMSLELYGFALNGLLYRSNKTAIPRVAGSENGRLATAPLRRYIDGVVQRQALAVLCTYGGPPLSHQEAVAEGKKATRVINALVAQNPKQSQNINNLQLLERHWREQRSAKVPAMGTGKQNEVIIMGLGVVASCKGIEGTLRPGQKVKVQIQNMDLKTGRVSTILMK